MHLCVISDSHGDTQNIALLTPYIKDDVDVVIHLGDDSPDANSLRNIDFNVIKVPGVYEQIYADRVTERRKTEEFDGIKFLITHTHEKHRNDFPDEPGPEELSRDVDVVLYGHTHVPKIELVNNVLWINPGHIKKDDKRGFPPSYALITCFKNERNEKHIEVTIFELMTNKPLQKLSYTW